MARPRPAEIEALREARDELHRLADVYRLPLIDPREFLYTVLPMGNQDPTTEEKVNAFHLFMHGQISGDSYEWWTSEFCEPSVSDFELGSSDLERASDSEVSGGDLSDFVSTQATLEREIATFWEDNSAQRSEYRNMLNLVYDGKSEHTETYLNRNYQNIVLVPSITWVGSKPELSMRYCPITVEGMLAYALALLSDHTSAYFKYLQICNLPTCDNYFLSMRMPKRKERMLKYCNTAHLKQGKALKNAESSAKHRKRKVSKTGKKITKRESR